MLWASEKKIFVEIQNKGQKFLRSTAGLIQERQDTREGREMVAKETKRRNIKE